MAKKHFKLPQHSVGKTVTTKSHFGSHANMVVDHTSISGVNIHLNEDEVFCKDDTGYYVTNKNRLDNGMADPNRYGNESKRFYV